MNLGYVQEEVAFDVVGISIVTTTHDAVTKGTIGLLWQQFFAQHIYDQIPHKIDTTVIAVYYNFESDKHGVYTTLIGARVSSVEDLPLGFTAFRVPAEKRVVALSDVGPMSEVVFHLWQKIWSLEDEGKLAHSYKADYEIYDQRSQDPQLAQVEIHVGVK